MLLLFYAGHPWVQSDGAAPDRPLDSAVLTRLKQFSAMNKLKKIAIRVITALLILSILLFTPLRCEDSEFFLI